MDGKTDLESLKSELAIIEELRQTMVAQILERTRLSINEFRVDIDINFTNDTDNDLYEAAKALGWYPDENDGVEWCTTGIPRGGTTTVFRFAKDD